MAVLELQDSRRLTGANLVSADAGAVIDVAIDGFEPELVVATWRGHVRQALDAIGWSAERIHSRVYSGGASLAISAPSDSLYAATEVNEWAFEATSASLRGATVRLAAAVDRLKDQLAAEHNPALRRLQERAGERNVMFLSDDEFVSVGMGTGSHTWSVDSIPEPDDVPWDEVHDIPAVMVTGSNGKTTTVRLLAAMARTAGYDTGYTCTDGVFVNNAEVEGGDYAGPGGARKLVRDRRVAFAVLETARGGMLRRGLGIPRADAAIVTNVCEDHLGEWGAHTLGDLVQVKLVIARAVEGGDLVINLDDTALAAAARKLVRPVTWFTTDPDHRTLVDHVAGGGAACYRSQSGTAVSVGGAGSAEIIDLSRVPLTVDGHAIHNVSNVLGAIALARSVGLPVDAIRRTLETFGSAPQHNRGRGNFYEINGLKALVDFAHNPHGARALVAMAGAVPAVRRMVMIGQAGDRDDTSIREMTRVLWELRPDLVVVKEMPKYLRGREDGDVTRVIIDELHRMGAPQDSIRHTASEIEAVRTALEWSGPGDLLILPVLAERDQVIELIELLRNSDWQPGNLLPPPASSGSGST